VAQAIQGKTIHPTAAQAVVAAVVQDASLCADTNVRASLSRRCWGVSVY
jgi:hypothetical protein